LGSTVLSIRLDEETYREFVEAAKMNRGPDAIISDVLREMVVNFIQKQSNRIKEERAEKEQPSEKAYSQEQAEGAKEKGHGSTALEVPEEETPSKLGLGEASKEASKVAEIPPLIEPVKAGGQQCYYHRVSHKKGFIDCMRKYAKTEEIDRFTQQICDYCWSLDPYRKYPIS
jgi:hypothetical protein